MRNAVGSPSLTTSPPTRTRDGTLPGPAGSIAATAKVRIDSVDLLRGLIMVIMMLDHTRDFIHRDALAFDAANVARTFPALFFTRWITHFCAPLFVFLAGTSVCFQEMRGKSKAQLSQLLITRGLWLVAIEVVVLRPLVFFNFNYGQMLAFLQVIWVIGWSMVVLAAAIHLPVRWLAGLSLAVIALHNTLDSVRVTTFNGPGTPLPGFGASLWILLHQQSLIFPFGLPVFVVYPFVPWMAVMGAGYAFGWWYQKAEPDRRRLFVRVGVAIVLGFVVIRAINIYGDPSRWTTQFGGVKTLLSFLATTKYPPSLLYLMMTLGPGILFLAWAERHTRGAFANVLITFGRVPFWFYLLQWIVAHLLAVGAAWMTGKPVAYLFTTFILAPALPAGAGFSLGVVYLLWILGVILTYPLCVWFAGVKARRRDWWISYL